MTIHIIITMVLLLAFLIGSIWYAKKKYQINLAVLGLGAVAFFVSSQILEKLVHILVLHPQKDGSIDPLTRPSACLYPLWPSHGSIF